MSKDLTDVIERRIIEIVEKAGEQGVIQREIWDQLNIDSRKGIKILRRLEQRGYLIRIAVMHKGRKTYLLKLSPKVFKRIELPKWLDEIPCFYCPYLLRCNLSKVIEGCEKLNRWLRQEDVNVVDNGPA